VGGEGGWGASKDPRNHANPRVVGRGLGDHEQALRVDITRDPTPSQLKSGRARGTGCLPGQQASISRLAKRHGGGKEKHRVTGGGLGQTLWETRVCEPTLQGKGGQTSIGRERRGSLNRPKRKGEKKNRFTLEKTYRERATR